MRYLPLWQLDKFYYPYRASGGVVDFLVYSTAGYEEHEEMALQRRASILALQAFTEAANLHSEGILKAGLIKKPVRRWELSTEKAACKPISWREFTGHSEEEQRFNGLYPNMFLEPPYGLRISKEEAVKLLDASLAFLKPDHDPEPAIYSWTTDLATYFEAGDEWWGSGLWTISIQSGAAIVVIGASSTD